MNTEVNPKLVQDLRRKTGAGMMNCKKALLQVNGDFEKAIEVLRQKGLASAEKKSDRTAAEGLIEAYIHTGRKLGVLLEINCETDFVARRSEFQELAKDIAMQIAASPQVNYISMEDIPPKIIIQEKIIESIKDDLGEKPAEIREKIINGRVEKILKTKILFEQAFIKDNTKTIEDLIKEHIDKLGENIKIAKFTRFELGK
jgi:elongation factor Ts